MDIKKCIIIGAGNAGRPVANLLNFIGVDVTVTDVQTYEQLNNRRQEQVDILKSNGVKFEFGVQLPDISEYDSIYLAPTIDESAPIRLEAQKQNKTIVTRKMISEIVDDILDMKKIGITGSFGKTTTTTMITSIFEAAGYNVYHCSSVKQNLVSEALIRDIVNGVPNGADIAILELPHGTLGLLGQIKLDIGIITTLIPEHLSEFGGSMQKYVDRKSVILDTSDVFIANCQCGDLLTYKREDTIYYNMESSFSSELDLGKYPPKFKSYIEDNHLHITYESDGKLVEEAINFKSNANYNYENLTAATAVALTYGLTIEDVQKGIDSFESIGGRMEYLGNYNGAETYYDASFGPSIRQALDPFKDENIIIIFGSLDTGTIRDKKVSAEVVNDYANIIIATGYTELNNTLNMDSAIELLSHVENNDIIKMAVCDVDEAAELAVKYAKKGDYIIHLGPGTSNSYQQIKDKLLKGLEEGSKRYANN